MNINLYTGGRKRRFFSAALLISIGGFLSECGKPPEKGWVVRVKDQAIFPAEFLEKIKESMFYRQNESFSPAGLIKFADQSLAEELYFAVEGYELGIDKDPQVRETIHNRQIDLIGKRDGPLFRQVIPADVEVSEEQMRRLYEQHKSEIGKPYEEVKEQLLAKMTNDYMAQRIEEYANSLFSQFSFQIDSKGVQLLIRLTSSDRETVNKLLETQNPEENPRSVPLVNYTGAVYSVTDVIAKFPRYFAGRPKKFSTQIESEEFLRKEFLPELLFLDAEKRGITGQAQVQEAFDRSTRRIISAECDKRLTVRNIKVTEQEVEERYQRDLAKYANTSPAKAKYDIRIILHGEKRRAKSKQVREELKNKYRLEYNTAALKTLANQLNAEKAKKDPPQ
jgi:hypothetical protein